MGGMSQRGVLKLVLINVMLLLKAVHTAEGMGLENQNLSLMRVKPVRPAGWAPALPMSSLTRVASALLPLTGPGTDSATVERKKYPSSN